MLIQREISQDVRKATPPKAVVVLGPRQVGKSTLFKQIIDPVNSLWLDGDKPRHVKLLVDAYQNDEISSLLQRAPTLVIDEAQRIPNIGVILKLLVDENQSTQIFATGSSSLELASGVRESALGRLELFQLWPFSLAELVSSKGRWNVQQSLAERIVYGMFPAAVDQDQPANFLSYYASELLYKDLFALAGVRSSATFENLVYQLAAHIGQEISYDSLAREVGLNKVTVIRYIDLLEQCFVVKVCHSFSSNLENELKNGKKLYFTDTGVRNAILNDFSPLSSRSDAGALWENFFFMERVKQNAYRRNRRSLRFWRTRSNAGVKPKEVDFVEIQDRKVINAFECKLSGSAHSRAQSEFLSRYPDVNFQVATPESVMDILAI